MYALLIVLTLIAAVLLICVVLIQKSKGGGLSSTFAGSNQIMGVRRTNSFIEKVTWTLAGAIVVLSVLASFVAPGSATVAPRATAAEQTTTDVNYETALPAAPAQDAAPVVPVQPEPAAE